MEGHSKYTPKAIHKRTKLRWRLLALLKMPCSHNTELIRLKPTGKSVCFFGLGLRVGRRNSSRYRCASAHIKAVTSVATRANSELPHLALDLKIMKVPLH